MAEIDAIDKGDVDVRGRGTCTLHVCTERGYAIKGCIMCLPNNWYISTLQPFVRNAYRPSTP
jgi:hypothetical protein